LETFVLDGYVSYFIISLKKIWTVRRCPTVTFTKAPNGWKELNLQQKMSRDIGRVMVTAIPPTPGRKSAIGNDDGFIGYGSGSAHGQFTFHL
jgi:hypothetical protein